LFKIVFKVNYSCLIKLIYYKTQNKYKNAQETEIGKQLQAIWRSLIFKKQTKEVCSTKTRIS